VYVCVCVSLDAGAGVLMCLPALFPLCCLPPPPPPLFFVCQAMARDLDKRLRVQIDFLAKCRPHSFGTGNAIRCVVVHYHTLPHVCLFVFVFFCVGVWIALLLFVVVVWSSHCVDGTGCSFISVGAHRFVRGVIANLPLTWTDDEAKHEVLYEIDRYIQERIQVADDAIVSHLLDHKKIVDGDVILTYARSNVVELSLKRAHDRGINFRVIIADARPQLEGKDLLQRLERHGLRCTYIWLNALTYVMKDVTKVILGAASMLSNGAALSRVGTGLVSTVAASFNKPVLFCCETYKVGLRWLACLGATSQVASPALSRCVCVCVPTLFPIPLHCLPMLLLLPTA